MSNRHRFDDENLYDVLGVDKDANNEEIRDAYHKKAKEHHPDKGGDAMIFASVSFAYKVLSDPASRKEYDEFGSTSEASEKEKAALEHIKQIIQQLISAVINMNGYGSRETALATATKKVLKEQIRDTKKMIEEAKRVIRSLEQILHKTKRKKQKSKPNIFDGIANGMIEDRKNFISKASAQLEMLECAVSIVDEYEDVLPEQVPSILIPSLV